MRLKQRKRILACVVTATIFVLQSFGIGRNGTRSILAKRRYDRRASEPAGLCWMYFSVSHLSASFQCP